VSEDDQFELSVEEEVQGILTRYQVTVDISEGPSDGEASLECHATRPGEDEKLASLALYLPTLGANDLGLGLNDEVQAKLISLAVVAMAKMLQIQEQSGASFFSKDCAEA
jgi:hypothetical protein